MVKISPNDPCPCDSGKKYKKCCRSYHTEKLYPPTPQAVARARYAAYALENIDFIMLSTHPESPHRNPNENRWRAELAAFSFRNLFPKFEILSAEDDKVSYRAEILGLGIDRHSYVEHCVFKQFDGKWMYFDGEMQDVAEDTEQQDDET